jgi:hypothetical protein
MAYSSNLPAGVLTNNLLDSLALARTIESIGQAVNDDHILGVPTSESVSKLSNQALVLNASELENLAKSSANILPISNLAEMGMGQALPAEANAVLSPQNIAMPVLEPSMIDLSLLPAGAPVVITQLSAGDHSAVTVIDKADTNVQISDFRLAQAETQTYINTGLGTLIVTTPATNLSSLSLSGKVEFVATGVEVSSGITVSGLSDSSDVALYITGGASSSIGARDIINLGDGNNVVFDAGDGAIYINLGSGSNSVILSGQGASGVINFSTHSNTASEFVAIAANGLASAQALANAPLIVVTGLNVGPNSLDAISFLSDMNGNLVWAGGTAQSAQVQLANQEQSNLESWISAAQEVASQAHSIAWFQFDGATYILETVVGANGARTSDTLVKLMGASSFTGVDGELSQGILHLLG